MNTLAAVCSLGQPSALSSTCKYRIVNVFFKNVLPNCKSPYTGELAMKLSRKHNSATGSGARFPGCLNKLVESDAW